MKTLIICIILATLAGIAQARDVYVDGYVRSNGTYVEPYVRSSPNHTTLDNYGDKGLR